MEEEYYSGDDDECQTVCTETFECPDHHLEWCEMTECHDQCSDKIECYAEWTNEKGDFEGGRCDDYWMEYECLEEEKDVKDVCDYEQCVNKDGSGECWIEECNMKDSCKPYICTRWEYVAEENYWTAIDCDDHHKDGEMDMDYIEYIFGHAGKVLAHYDDTLTMVANHVVENYVESYVEDNFDGSTIDSFLGDENAVEFTSTFLKDTDEMLDAFGVDADLDWAHEALQAEDHQELLDMFDGVFEEFWGKDDDKYDDEKTGDDMERSEEEEPTADYDEECFVMEEGDCFDEISNHVAGLESCLYQEVKNMCNDGEVHRCNAQIVVFGQEVEGDCYEMMEQFDIDPETLDMDADREGGDHENENPNETNPEPRESGWGHNVRGRRHH